jgi:hypothetical protein
MRKPKKDLTKSFPILNRWKKEKRIRGLKRMLKFYEAKIPEAPENQAKMFTEFCNSLHYSLSIIGKYDRLTHEIAGKELPVAEADSLFAGIPPEKGIFKGARMSPSTPSAFIQDIQGESDDTDEDVEKIHKGA